jgi:hypothetical protein
MILWHATFEHLEALSVIKLTAVNFAFSPLWISGQTIYYIMQRGIMNHIDYINYNRNNNVI